MSAINYINIGGAAISTGIDLVSKAIGLYDQLEARKIARENAREAKIIEQAPAKLKLIVSEFSSAVWDDGYDATYFDFDFGINEETKESSKLLFDLIIYVPNGKKDIMVDVITVNSIFEFYSAADRIDEAFKKAKDALKTEV